MLSVAFRNETQSLAVCALRCRARSCQNLARRTLASSAPSSLTAPSTRLSSVSPSQLPWFMDPSDVDPRPSPFGRRVGLPQAAARPLPPLPSDLPSGHHIARLHAELKASPHLEPGTLLVRSPIPTATGPPLPDSMPRGRRRRGRTYVGEGVLDNMGGIWEWVVIAQVCSSSLFAYLPPAYCRAIPSRSRRARRTAARSSRLSGLSGKLYALLQNLCQNPLFISLFPLSS